MTTILYKNKTIFLMNSKSRYVNIEEKNKIS